ncbi:MAG: hypothetical protein HYV54_00365 [Parcubacteria group bacterium]|nr:hypothetical protein [Parcubacteria group bacterium]
MEKVTVDKNYNSIKEFNYDDSMFDTAEEIKQALDGGKISTGAANILLNILISKEAKKESAGLLQWVNNNEPTVTTSLLINLSNRNKKYA